LWLPHISGILDFPNPIPRVNWLNYLPLFKDKKKDDVVMHLFKFHLHIRKLGVKFPEDCLMKMFMATLEDKARSWYEGFPSASLCSLKYFHAVFYEHFKEFCLPLPRAEKCCAYFEDFFQYLVNMYGDEENTDDEIKEAMYEFSSQW
jgi:hypothetical protein